MRIWFLKFHRWVALGASLPLIVIVVTGLILSIEAMLLDRSLTGRSIPVATIEAALAQHDPDSKAGQIAVRGFERVLILGARGSEPVRVDLATNTVLGRTYVTWSDWFLTARRLHEHLLLNWRGVVHASTVAMLAILVLGTLMGWRTHRHTLNGWHRSVGFLLAPLLFLSAFSGWALGEGWSTAGPAPKIEGTAVPLREAVRMVGARFDYANVLWLRPQGGGLRLRVMDGGEAKVYAVTSAGLTPMPRNWVRIWHEGTFAGAWSGLLNLILSLAFMGLLVTGVWMWGRRTWRMRMIQRR